LCFEGPVGLDRCTRRKGLKKKVFLVVHVGLKLGLESEIQKWLVLWPGTGVWREIQVKTKDEATCSDKK